MVHRRSTPALLPDGQLTTGSLVRLCYGYENCRFHSRGRLQGGRAPGSQNQEGPEPPFFSDALKEYLARHKPDSVTEAMKRGRRNALCLNSVSLSVKQLSV
jgi:hypothetical protein